MGGQDGAVVRVLDFQLEGSWFRPNFQFTCKEYLLLDDTDLNSLSNPYLLLNDTDPNSLFNP